jgi:hypothetical protein
MRTILFALLICSAASLAAQDAKIEEGNKSPVEAKFAPGGQIRMDLCSSGVELIGKDEGRLRVSYGSRHGNDDAVKVRIQVSGSEADLRVTGCAHNNFQMTIEVPKSSSLYIRMFAGDLNVRSITGDKDVKLHFGQLTMEIGNPFDYAHVQASVSSGDLEAPGFDISKGGLFRSFERTGPGKYRVYAHVGAGQLELR